MKTKEEILASAFSIPSEPGIYFLISGGEIVYVGQSRIPIRRIGDHARDKVFDSISFEPCRFEDLDERERHYIKAFEPRYNGDTSMRFPIRARDCIPDRLRQAAQAVRPISEDEYRALRKRQRPPRSTSRRTE